MSAANYDLPTAPKKMRKLRVVVASTSAPPPWLLEKLVRHLLEADVEPVIICDSAQISHASIIVKSVARENVSLDPSGGAGANVESRRLEAAREDAAKLAAWAELLILAPMEANSLAKMLHGITDSLLLELLRSWDVSKKILLIPGMSCAMWENPMTRKQLSKIRRKWKWITVFPPLLWNYDLQEKRTLSDDGVSVKRSMASEWEGMEELMGAVNNQLDLATIGHNVDVGKLSYRPSLAPRGGTNTVTRPLPPELWSIILEYTNDWELAKALNVRTGLPVPEQWQAHTNAPTVDGEGFHRRLEWALLHTDLGAARRLLASTSPLPKYLSRLSIQMIMRWALVPILVYLETAHRELFWTAFGHSFIPNKASAIFGRVELLEYWRTSPSFLTKEYTDEAMDQASANGFVHVLEWWKTSSLTLKYTEAALEIASARGHLDVLEWWLHASKHSPSAQQQQQQRRNSNASSSGEAESSSAASSPHHQHHHLLDLKPGRSISNATQAGLLPVLRWWAHSSIPFSHEDTIAKLASAHGHVHLLNFWLAHRGASKLLFDALVLVAPTKQGHAGVLQWWKEQARRGLRVEYKICDIEEALEDGGGRGAEEVRRWWARNGLNLGVGTSEWMRTKVLG